MMPSYQYQYQQPRPTNQYRRVVPVRNRRWRAGFHTARPRPAPQGPQHAAAVQPYNPQEPPFETAVQPFVPNQWSPSTPVTHNNTPVLLTDQNACQMTTTTTGTSQFNTMESETAAFLNSVGVIVSPNNFDCPICEKFFVSEIQALQHIITLEHRIRMTNSDFVKFFQASTIVKINQDYTCVQCYAILENLREVKFHNCREQTLRTVPLGSTLSIPPTSTLVPLDPEPSASATSALVPTLSARKLLALALKILASEATALGLTTPETTVPQIPYLVTNAPETYLEKAPLEISPLGVTAPQISSKETTTPLMSSLETTTPESFALETFVPDFFLETIPLEISYLGATKPIETIASEVSIMTTPMPDISSATNVPKTSLEIAPLDITSPEITAPYLSTLETSAEGISIMETTAPETSVSGKTSSYEKLLLTIQRIRQLTSKLQSSEQCALELQALCDELECEQLSSNEKNLAHLILNQGDSNLETSSEGIMSDLEQRISENKEQLLLATSKPNTEPTEQPKPEKLDLPSPTNYKYRIPKKRKYDPTSENESFESRIVPEKHIPGYQIAVQSTTELQKSQPLAFVHRACEELKVENLEQQNTEKQEVLRISKKQPSISFINETVKTITHSELKTQKPKIEVGKSTKPTLRHQPLRIIKTKQSTILSRQKIGNSKKTISKQTVLRKRMNKINKAEKVKTIKPIVNKPEAVGKGAKQLKSEVQITLTRMLQSPERVTEDQRTNKKSNLGYATEHQLSKQKIINAKYENQKLEDLETQQQSHLHKIVEKRHSRAQTLGELKKKLQKNKQQTLKQNTYNQFDLENPILKTQRKLERKLLFQSIFGTPPQTPKKQKCEQESLTHKETKNKSEKESPEQRIISPQQNSGTQIPNKRTSKHDNPEKDLTKSNKQKPPRQVSPTHRKTKNRSSGNQLKETETMDLESPTVKKCNKKPIIGRPFEEETSKGCKKKSEISIKQTSTQEIPSDYQLDEQIMTKKDSTKLKKTKLPSVRQLLEQEIPEQESSTSDINRTLTFDKEPFGHKISSQKQKSMNPITKKQRIENSKLLSVPRFSKRRTRKEESSLQKKNSKPSSNVITDKAPLKLRIFSQKSEHGVTYHLSNGQETSENRPEIMCRTSGQKMTKDKRKTSHNTLKQNISESKTIDNQITKVRSSKHKTSKKQKSKGRLVEQEVKKISKNRKSRIQPGVTDVTSASIPDASSSDEQEASEKMWSESEPFQEKTFEKRIYNKQKSGGQISEDESFENDTSEHNMSDQEKNNRQISKSLLSKHQTFKKKKSKITEKKSEKNNNIINVSETAEKYVNNQNEEKENSEEDTSDNKEEECDGKISKIRKCGVNRSKAGTPKQDISERQLSEEEVHVERILKKQKSKDRTSMLEASHKKSLKKRKCRDLTTEEVFQNIMADGKTSFYRKYETQKYKKRSKVLLQLLKPKLIPSTYTYMIFDEAAVDKYAWNGLVDTTCVLCDVEFEKPDHHIIEPRHKTNFIYNICMFGFFHLYRKLDDDQFFCVTCCTVYRNIQKQDHHLTDDHAIGYYKAKQYYVEKQKEAEQMAKGAGKEVEICDEYLILEQKNNSKEKSTKKCYTLNTSNTSIKRH